MDFFLASPDHVRTCTCMYANVPGQDQPGLWLVRVGSCMHIYVYMSADLALMTKWIDKIDEENLNLNSC